MFICVSLLILSILYFNAFQLSFSFPTFWRNKDWLQHNSYHLYWNQNILGFSKNFTAVSSITRWIHQPRQQRVRGAALPGVISDYYVAVFNLSASSPATTHVEWWTDALFRRVYVRVWRTARLVELWFITQWWHKKLTNAIWTRTKN